MLSHPSEFSDGELNSSTKSKTPLILGSVDPYLANPSFPFHLFQLFEAAQLYESKDHPGRICTPILVIVLSKYDKVDINKASRV